jgi:hypothetical protein
MSVAPLRADVRRLLRGPLYSVSHLEAILALRRLAPAGGHLTELAATAAARLAEGASACVAPARARAGRRRTLRRS